MMLRKLINSDYLAAEYFVDANFQPVTHKLTITNVELQKPPTGGKEKACFSFAKTAKKAFLANGEVKKIARFLRKADTNDWIGAELEITSGPKKFAGKPTTGMVVLSARLPNQPAQAEAPNDEA